jgi:hypothetical protein
MLKAGVISITSSPAFALAASQEKNPDRIDPDAGVTAPEDLLRIA